MSRRFRVHTAEIWLGFGFALLTLIMVGWVAIFTTSRLADSSAMVGHTYVVIEHLDLLREQIAAVEEAARVYSITGDPRVLKPVSATLRSMDASLANIRALVSDNPSELARADRLRRAVAANLALLDRVAGARRKLGQTAAAEFANDTAAHADARRRIATMVAVERGLLATRQKDENKWRADASRVILYGTLAAIAFVTFAGVFIFKALRTLRAAMLYATRSSHAAHKRGEELAVQVELARQGREQVTALLESATDAILTVDRDGRVAYANRRASQYFGYSTKELSGLPVEQLVPQDIREVHHRLRGEFMEHPQARGMAEARDLQAQRKDGSVFPVEISLSPVTTRAGTQVLVTLRDVTESRSAQEYRAQISALVDASRYAMISYRCDGTVLTWNQGARILYGWAPEEIIGQNASVMIPDDELPGYRAQVSMVVAGSNAETYETTRRRKDGSTVEVTVSKAPIFDAHGAVVAISTISYDITERIRTERELRERTAELARSNAELEQFAYVASHDLQEPLRMVASYLQLIEQRYRGRLDSDADDFINYAVDGARRMKQLINDLLNYSRSGRGPDPRPVELGRVLERAMTTLALAIEENHAVVEAGRLPRVMGDENRLAEVFQNLIGNALKFKGAALPEVRIEATRDGNFWTISVADNGIGIEPAYQERIFAMFQRLHRREEFPGTGIGLAICKRIVERLGGRIWVESQPGCGATFRFTLPAELEEAGATISVGQS